MQQQNGKRVICSYTDVKPQEYSLENTYNSLLYLFMKWRRNVQQGYLSDHGIVNQTKLSYKSCAINVNLKGNENGREVLASFLVDLADKYSHPPCHENWICRSDQSVEYNKQ